MTSKLIKAVEYLVSLNERIAIAEINKERNYIAIEPTHFDVFGDYMNDFILYLADVQKVEYDLTRKNGKDLLIIFPQ